MGLSIAICPSTPLLVPELGGGAAAQTRDLRDAALRAVRTLPRRWLAIGTDTADGHYGPGVAGTFAGYGADVPVALSADTTADAADLPLSVLIAGWLRGRVSPAVTVEARVLATGSDGLAAGRALRAEIDAAPVPIGVLIVADGANALTEKAPGGYLPEATREQEALGEALIGGRPDALVALSELITGRAAYRLLAGLVAADRIEAQCLYRGSPFGVGYIAATWQLP